MYELTIEYWVNCSTPDCPNKQCLWSGYTLCYECCVWYFGKDYMTELYRSTHPEEIEE